MTEKTLAEKTRSYFLKPGFRRMLAEVWRRYAGLEKVGGHAVIAAATAEECDAVNTFFGWNRKPGETIKVPLHLFERELENSSFPYTLAELHAVLTGKPLLTKTDRELLAREAWAAVFREVRETLLGEGERIHSQLNEWLERLMQGAAGGYRTLKELMRESPAAAVRQLTYAARAFNVILTGDAGVRSGSLQLRSIRLPVLAAQVSGDAHALDRTRPAGRLFFQALKESVHGNEVGDSPVEGSFYNAVSDATAGLDSLLVRDIYRTAGIADDDISSIVHFYDPNGERPVLPGVLTLRQVEAAERFEPFTDVYVVENPPVFSTLVDLAEAGMRAGTELSSGAHRPLLLCTSGPASAAALRLIDRFIEHGRWSGRLFYSGDFDIKGLEIGNVLAARYRERFTEWRFGAGTYAHGVEGNGRRLSFTGEERVRLGKFKALWDAWLADDMVKSGYKLFQEQIVSMLGADWLNALEGRHPSF
ncbi:MAG TPA: TIGR02679 domain-containing protein [Paenibacillus sp.]|uniref:TIGR02679 domain-containing protein n=1 Tax=Paenibacillus sp. TaxID=58172 RepID=UPI002CE0E244|nr:TIGR02679 domain-containing protein [Paenibacillus sp.]HUC92072.1 TIGR02679 domain-containing protein [Paenibacillus sp.]